LDRFVAIKVLSGEVALSPDARASSEARTISQLTHPHICTLYDVGRHEDVEFLVMELLEGETLAARLSRGPLPMEQTLRYGVEMAGALHAAHRHGTKFLAIVPGPANQRPLTAVLNWTSEVGR
jgi:serine/threonine protein kinase